MACKLACLVTAALVLRIFGASAANERGDALLCPSDPNCVCSGTLSIELTCNFDGRIVKINLLPNTYINIKCENTTALDYSKLPKCANHKNMFKSVSFKECPLPKTSFKEVLTNLGVSKTMALIFQNAKNLTGYFDRKHFSGLQNLKKLLLSVNGITHLPDNLFTDINNLTWLNIRSNSINLTEELFSPLERLETLEISHNHLTNISSNLFSHLSLLRKLSLWQSNVTWFSEDFFTGVDVLEELDLSSNGLNELPASIFKPLRKLKKLTLFSNKFSSLPQDLFESNDNLETVIILNNDVKLNELPKYLFGGFQNLKQVYIQRCGLEKLPYDVFDNSSNITNISLSYNDIEELPESIFNDQINLLDMDLSHNKLKKLEPKLFSSLVRLENLNLCHNSLIEISGSTFSSLLSLIYLNMENNHLKSIPSNLFSNSKQRMSISLAYNQLSFENKELVNNSWVVKRTSPFAQTYYLRLLNLSHNVFNAAFDDWWLNGHEILDISHNSIEYLWTEEGDGKSFSGKPNYQDLLKKPMKELWLSHNPLQCKCSLVKFIDFLELYANTKVYGSEEINCSIWDREFCYFRYIIIMSAILVLGVIFVTLSILFLVYRKNINQSIKKSIKVYRQQRKKYHNVLKKTKYVVDVRYCDLDEVFVLKEVVPQLTTNTSLTVKTTLVTSNTKLYNNFNNKANKTLVIFTSNYLMSAYSQVDIKKIRVEMSDTTRQDTVYIFVDVGPYNSIFAFLKDQRDESSTMLWNEPLFWGTIMSKLDQHAVKRSSRLPRRDSNVGCECYFSWDYNGLPKRLKAKTNATPHNFTHSQV